ncbi:hypothetical protein [uncultured Roseibium sp.]|uniref:hypothetical protein n=1 Tax=uncultured Roseibium sp. TaxID=1936171 RepID=UPI003216C22E
MIDTTLGQQPKAALGIGSLIGETCSIYARYFLPITIVAFVFGAIGLAISIPIVGFDSAIGIKQPQVADLGILIVSYSSTVVKIAIGSFATALLLQLAYDAKLGRPIQFGRYFGPALSAIVPLVILSLVQSISFTIGLVFLIVPGLWIYAVFSVMDPAVVIERAGFRGLHRSASLTKNYRWLLVGLFALMLILIFSLDFAATFLAKIIVPAAGMATGLILIAALNALGKGFAIVLITLIYARLREIKEGVSVHQITSVFD